MTDRVHEDWISAMAGYFRLLGDPKRLAILQRLSGREQSVAQVMVGTRLRHSTVSRHLNMLANAGIVGRRKAGLHVLYRLGSPDLEPIFQVCLRLVLNDGSTPSGQCAARSEASDLVRLTSGRTKNSRRGASAGVGARPRRRRKTHAGSQA